MRETFEQLKSNENLVGVEVGVAGGENALDILNELDIKKLYLVDIWSKYKEEGNGNMDSTGFDNNARNILKKYKNKIVFVKKLSVKAAKDFKDGSLDFVYIDANHQYEFVKEDIEAWWPKIKVGGILGGDDAGRDGVKKAVSEFFPQWKFSGQRDWYEYKS